MISKERKKEIKLEVIRCLRKMGEVELPVDVQELCRVHGIILKSFGDLMEDEDLAWIIKGVETPIGETPSLCAKDIYKVMGTKEACTHRHGNKSFIYYNDLYFKRGNPERTSFSIAHELGHIMLGHFSSANDSKSNKRLEIEADLFASYLLAPFSVLLKLRVKTKEGIGEFCHLSKRASHIIYNKYRRWIEHNYPQFSDEYDWEIAKIYSIKKMNKNINTE